MIKLLALDLDGTVLNSQGQVPEANRNAIRAAEDAGVLVTIATGRRFRDARPVGIELELNAPLVTHNGALLKYAATLETVDASLLDLDVALDVIRLGRTAGGDALVSADPHGKGTLLYDRISDDNIPLQKYIRWAEGLHGEDAEEAVHHVESLEHELKAHDVIHISFSGGCSRMADLQEMLREGLNGTATILATIYPKLDFTLLDILPKDASKGIGLERLAARHDIRPDEVMAIGDNFNDLEMLEFAGTPVVMGNADPELLARPNCQTTLTNDESGVAAAIDRFVLGRR
ncbi:MAG: HAD family phosphatase [Blastocatellia bacterium]|nr:HAD family phosphatase [Blastocatellia bacterium]